MYDGGLYTSLAAPLSGLTAGALIAGSFSSTRFDPTNSSDYGGFIRAVDRLPDRAAFYALYDGDGDGTITPDELAARLVYDSPAGNPHGAINYERLVQTELGSQDTRSDGLSFFVQDTFSVTRNLSFNLGVRTERFAHVATDGTNIFTFDWRFAPRLSVSYDPPGDGRQRISAFYGKYYDPIRNNLTNFAGTLTGSVREEQVYGRPARLDRAPVQGQLVVLLGQRLPDRRQLALELGHARQPDVPGVRPQPADPRRAGRGVRVRRHHAALALARGGRLAREPAYGIVDVRLLYNYRVAGARVELFADIFNLFDNQDATRNQDLQASAGGIAFGDGIRFTPPRQLFLGARLSF